MLIVVTLLLTVYIARTSGAPLFAHSVELSLGNRNIVAGSVLLHSLAAFLLRPMLWPFTLIFGILTLLFIGSRTGLCVVVLLALVICNFRASSNRGRIALITLLTLLVLVLTPAAVVNLLERNYPKRTVNLLSASIDLTDPVWKSPGAAHLLVHRESIEGPYRGGSVHRLIATPDASHNEPRIMLLQGTERGEAGVEYRVSAYIRSDHMQPIRVSSNYTAAECTATREWSLCDAPLFTGNGTANVQFQLQFVDGLPVDIYIWGPQVSRVADPIGPIEYEHTSSTHRLDTWLRHWQRLDLRSWTHDEDIRQRIRALEWAFKMIASSPIYGHGIGSFEALFARSHPTDAPVNHAHNLLVQLLFEGGVLRVASFILLIAGSIAVLQPRTFETVILLLWLVLANLADINYYSAATYYTFWLTLSLLPKREQAEVHLGDTKDLKNETS